MDNEDVKASDHKEESRPETTINETTFIKQMTLPSGFNEKDFTKMRNDLEESNKIEITVSEPLIKDGAFKHVTYKVAGKDSKGEFDQRRRYSDFSELREKMTQNWPGIFIPSIPEKKISGNMEKEFISERQSYLDVFVKAVAQRPYLYYSEEFQVFLRNSFENI